MHLGKRHHNLRMDMGGVESPVEDLFALMIVVVIIVLFISSLSTIYGIKADQDHRSALWDRCLSFSTTVLNHPMMFEDTFNEEGLFSGFKLQDLKSAYERRQVQASGGGDGGGGGPAPRDGEGADPLTDLIESVNSEAEFGWELYFQDLSDYPSRTGFTFSLRSQEVMSIEMQSLVWTVSIFIDADEVHVARLTVLVWEV